MEFDRDEVVEQVAELFWTRGYDATGMNDIVEATGLNKSSIYNTFGSKDALFCEALRSYMARKCGQPLMVASDGSAGLADLHSMIDWQMEAIGQSDGARGCFLVNSGVELSHRNAEVADESCAHRHLVREALRSALLRAVDLGEVDPARVDSAIELLAGLLLATSLFERSGADLDELRSYLGAQHDFIETLRR